MNTRFLYTLGLVIMSKFMAEANVAVEQYIAPHQRLILDDAFDWERLWVNTLGFIMMNLIIIGCIHYLKLYREVRENRQFTSLSNDQDYPIFKEHHELTVLSLQVLEGNRRLENYQKRLQAIRRQLGNEELKSHLRGVIREMKQDLNLDKDWEMFRLQFNTLHPQFFQKLRATSAVLTNTDLKYCAYLYMKLSIKKTALFMSVSPQAVKMARHRIKKKLGIAKEMRLYEFLNRL